VRFERSDPKVGDWEIRARGGDRLFAGLLCVRWRGMEVATRFQRAYRQANVAGVKVAEAARRRFALLVAVWEKYYILVGGRIVGKVCGIGSRGFHRRGGARPPGLRWAAAAHARDELAAQGAVAGRAARIGDHTPNPGRRDVSTRCRRTVEAAQGWIGCVRPRRFVAGRREGGEFEDEASGWGGGAGVRPVAARDVQGWTSAAPGLGAALAPTGYPLLRPVRGTICMCLWGGPYTFIELLGRHYNTASQRETEALCSMGGVVRGGLGDGRTHPGLFRDRESVAHLRRRRRAGLHGMPVFPGSFRRACRADG